MGKEGVRGSYPEMKSNISKIRPFLRLARHGATLRGLLGVFLWLVAITGLGGGVRGSEEPLPFSPGEKLTYEVRWSVIPAGEAIFQVLPSKTFQGVVSHHFRMTGKTKPWLDLFYKVRGKADSFANGNLTRSLLYREHSEGRDKKDVVVQFRWARQEAQYSNFGEKKPPIPIMARTYDPLTLFYVFRLQDLKVGGEVSIPVTDGKKCFMGRGKVLRKERIHVGKRPYDTFVVKPELEHLGGVFKRSKNAEMKVWVSADEKKIPLRVESKVFVGSFVAELVSAEGIY